MSHVYPGNPANVAAHDPTNVTNPDDGDALTAASNNAAIEALNTLADQVAYLMLNALLRDESTGENLTGKVDVTSTGSIVFNSGALLELATGADVSVDTDFDTFAGFALLDDASGDSLYFMQGAPFPGTVVSTRGFTVETAALPSEDDSGYLYDVDRVQSMVLMGSQFQAQNASSPPTFVTDLNGLTGGAWFGNVAGVRVLMSRQRLPAGAVPGDVFILVENTGAGSINFRIRADLQAYNASPTTGAPWTSTNILATQTVSVGASSIGWAGPFACSGAGPGNNKTLVISVELPDDTDGRFHGCALNFDYFKLNPET